MAYSKNLATVLMMTLKYRVSPYRFGSFQARSGSGLQIKTLGFVLGLLALNGGAALAQNAPTLRQGNIEVGGFAGGGYGLGTSGSTVQGSTGNFTVSETAFHVMGGGDFGYALTKSFFLVGEASYFPTISPAVSSTPPAAGCSPCFRTDLTYDRRVVEFNGGVHYRLPVPESRVVPYLAFGVGAAHFLSSTVAVTSTRTDNCTSNCVKALPSLNAAGATGAEIAVGGGVRVYATEHFGFRGEFRLYHPFSLDNVGNFYRVTGGIFFQLK